MDRQRSFRHALLAVVLGAFGVSGIVLATDEIEPNHPISSAQPLSVAGGVVAGIGGTAVPMGGATVNGIVGNLTGSDTLDVDFYSFQGQALDVVTIDIRGMGGVRDVDTILYVFGPGPTYEKLRENDDCDRDPPDPGSHPFDSCIINFTLPATGTYTVGVSSYPLFLGHGGIYTSTMSANANGDYTLVISGVTLSVQPINIDIKPGSGALAPVNPKSRGKIPVALLSSSEFNALDVNVASLTFGATGNEPSLSSCGKDGKDVNGDGRPDLVCHFDNQLARFTPGDLEGIVKGRTADDRQFEGRGLLKVVPAKRKH